MHRDVVNEKAVARLGSRTQRISLLYNCLAVGTIVVFVVGLYFNDWELAELQDNPLVGMDLPGLRRMGATDSPSIVYQYQYWRLASSLFISAGVIHIWANLSTIWVYSNLLVQYIRAEHILVIYLASGVGGVLASANIGNEHVTSAASAPAFGMMGGAIVLMLLRWRKYRNHFLTALVMVVSLGINTFIGATPFVDNSANAAGLVIGALLAASFLLMLTEEADVKSECRLQLTSAVLAGLAATIIVVGLVGLNTNLPAGDCCEQLVCTSSSLWNCGASIILPTQCSYTNYPNGTTLLQCPVGSVYTLTGLNGTQTSAQLDAYCSSYCNLAQPPTAPSGPFTPSDR